MITARWKKCPSCNSRYGFETHGGMTRGWQREFFGPPTESCPHCLITLRTGKVQRIRDLSNNQRIKLYLAITFEWCAILTWFAVASVMVGWPVGYVSGSTLFGIVCGAIVFALLVYRMASNQRSDYIALK